MTYILDRDGKPLMPTKRGNLVRHMLKAGVAKVVRYEPFTVMILRDVGHCVQEVALGVDVGSKHIGLSATTEKKELYSAQVELRDDVSELLTARREFRRGRRGRRHNWYRPARWANRANEEGNAALPPSIKHKADSHIRAIGFVCKMLPIAHIRLEIGKFDIQQLVNPEIQGEQYQQGTLAGWRENLRAYAKWRDGYKCRLCGASPRKDPNVRLEVHHIIHRAKVGPDVPDNVVTLCKECHDNALHKNKTKFKRPPQHKGEAHMNTMKDYLRAEVHRLYGDRFAGVTYGYRTAMARREHGIEKSHAADAFCIAGHFGAERNARNLYWHKMVRRHTRSLHHATVESPKKKSKAVQKAMSAKMMKFGFRLSQKAPKRVKGFAKYDTVKYKGDIWTITGSSGNNFYLTRHKDLVKTKNIGYKYIKKICSCNGMWTAKLDINPIRSKQR